MKGFTLVELLAVIIILGVVVSITAPIVITNINKSAEKLYQEQIKSIENTAEKWVIEHTGEVERTDNFQKCVSVEEFKKEGYIPAEDIINPKTKQPMNGCVDITYDSNYKQFKYEYKEV